MESDFISFEDVDFVLKYNIFDKNNTKIDLDQLNKESLRFDILKKGKIVWSCNVNSNPIDIIVAGLNKGKYCFRLSNLKENKVLQFGTIQIIQGIS